MGWFVWFVGFVVVGLYCEFVILLVLCLELKFLVRVLCDLRLNTINDVQVYNIKTDRQTDRKTDRQTNR